MMHANEIWTNFKQLQMLLNAEPQTQYTKGTFDVTGEQVTNVTNGMEQEETLARSYINCTNH